MASDASSVVTVVANGTANGTAKADGAHVIATAASSTEKKTSTHGGVASDRFTWDTKLAGRSQVDDLPGVHHALVQFLESKMLECEAFIRECDPNLERLYFSTGIALIQCIKGIMSFEDKDLAAALASIKHSSTVAHKLRKSQPLTSRFAVLVLGGGTSSAVNHVKSMTPLQRHAELVYAEGLLEKAVIGIAYSGDWFQFIKEALNMRTATGIYRTLVAYLQQADANGFDNSIDPHFRSGVMLGQGLTSLVLSMLPSRVMSIIELFGYKGDRFEALSTLSDPGGWASTTPTSARDEGVRRPVCDIALLIFHLVLRAFTTQGIDIAVAERILEFNLQRFPNGVFFLFGAGRIAFCRSQPHRATVAYQRALESQDQYPQMHYLAFWELAVCAMARWRLDEAIPYWRTLRQEASWSKACYAYGAAACLLQQPSATDGDKAEASKFLADVPSLLNRIGGKSIPVEKFVARKARKYTSQGNTLLLPAVEFGYVLGSLSHADARTLRRRIRRVVRPEYERAKNADDVALANFLYGIVLRYIAHPDTDAKPDDEEASPELEAVEPDDEISEEDAESQSRKCFERVLEVGDKIQYEHWLLYYTHYELAQLLTVLKTPQLTAARTHLELVGSGKHLEGPGHARKGKYSMENALAMKVHAALEVMDAAERETKTKSQ
ncbi:hypothetical protein BKA62DRAFT_695771 [Auriculariales sp. MPI-PUGE-AT-0066]|nr:hypothetical protein BKA62DRAFT_695771 [Auriculariales sp. MPI-PUGE-AT-0066]